MDTDAELLKAKWLLIGCVAFVVSGCFSWSELQYAVRGRRADAQIDRAYESYRVGRRGRRIPHRVVKYTFTEEDGTRRSESDRVDLEFPVPDAPTIPVEFLPGKEGASRLEGHRRTVPVLIFLACFAGMCFAGFVLWREARATVLGSKRDRR